jgi:FMN phosphatase YigB (HAD superfamily)
MAVSAADNEENDELYDATYLRTLISTLPQMTAEISQGLRSPVDLSILDWEDPIQSSIDALPDIVMVASAIAFISNSDGQTEARLRRLGILQWLRRARIQPIAVVDSAVVQARKPSPEIFKFGMRAVNRDSCRIVHVGDSVRFDVEGARNSGITPVHYDPLALCGASDHAHCESLQALGCIVDLF